MSSYTTKILVLLAMTPGLVFGALCDVTKFAPLATDPRVASCQEFSGYNLATLEAPNKTHIERICASGDCLNVFNVIKAAVREDCSLGAITSVHGMLESITCGVSDPQTAAQDAEDASAPNRSVEATPSDPATMVVPEAGSGPRSSTPTPSTTHVAHTKPTIGTIAGACVAILIAIGGIVIWHRQKRIYEKASINAKLDKASPKNCAQESTIIVHKDVLFNSLSTPQPTASIRQ